MALTRSNPDPPREAGSEGGDGSKKRGPFMRYGLPTAVLDVKETAAYFGITSRQVYRLVRSGELPHTRVGLSLRFRIEDLDRYLAARTSQTWTRMDKRGRPAKQGLRNKAERTDGRRELPFTMVAPPSPRTSS